MTTPSAEGTSVLILIVVLAVGLYAGTCYLWPYTSCRRCHGGGKVRSPFGTMWRKCTRCTGDGQRLRMGGWLFGRAGSGRR
jgi:hypothetical protein